MLIIFFDCVGVAHYEFAPRSQTINKEYYVEVPKRLRDAVRRKRLIIISYFDPNNLNLIASDLEALCPFERICVHFQS